MFIDSATINIVYMSGRRKKSVIGYLSTRKVGDNDRGISCECKRKFMIIEVIIVSQSI